MNNTLTKQQRSRYFIVNMLSFGSIFIVLGLIVFQLLQTTIYQNVDETLSQLSENKLFLQTQLLRNEPWRNRKLDLGDMPPPNNFQQQVILWSSDGQILNTSELGSRKDDFHSLSLNPDQLQTLTTLHVQDSNGRTLQFRSITLSIKSQPQLVNPNHVAYIQLLQNTDPIQNALDRFTQILILCMGIFSILSIILSYFLSRWFMKPVLLSWKKQQEFVENASHELRTPLTIIQAKLESLFTRPNQTILEESETIALSLAEVQRLEQLTSDLLLLARSDANVLVIEKEPVWINEFLTKTVAPYRELAEAEEKQLHLLLSENAQADFDPKRMQQLLIILLDNALKYSKTGDTITVSSSMQQQMWHVKIIDTGQGMSEEQKQHAFERFYRGDQSRNRKTGGYGIGLSIAKWIVDNHHGHISFEDTQPKGTTVLLSFPKK